MIYFENDYSEGASPQILEALKQSNDIQASGYGLDIFCDEARELIKNEIGNNKVDIHFIPGGTPCNMLAIATLRSHEAVIACTTGHINTHETGAVESTGHKIYTIPSHDGKMDPSELKQAILLHTDEHMVKPKMVFITNSTEYGTIYTKKELKAISAVCKKYGLYLYLDGARIANALVAKGNDLSLKDICELTDMFYIGGTKNGALLGEALIIKNDELKKEFRYILKQKGSMLAKGRTIGITFKTFFADALYYNNAIHANDMAQQLKRALIKKKIPLLMDTPTNQIFPIMDNKLIKRLHKKFVFLKWADYDDKHSVVRLVCSWDTKQEHVDEFIKELNKQ